MGGEQSDVWQKSICESEKEGLQGGSETSYVVWIGDSQKDKNTRGSSASCIFEVGELTILVESDKDGCGW